MRAGVDARGQVVCRGEQTWPFDLDCRDGSASIAIAGRSFRVRPLLWREKRTLARFAHLGEEFLSRQFLQITVSSPTGAAIGDGGNGEDALLALATWLNDPGPDPSLPFEVATLSRSLAAVCLATGLGPEAFDDRPAHEVEALGRVAPAEEMPEPPVRRGAQDMPGPGTTTILVVPDAAPPDHSPQALPPTTPAPAPVDSTASLASTTRGLTPDDNRGPRGEPGIERTAAESSPRPPSRDRLDAPANTERRAQRQMQARFRVVSPAAIRAAGMPPAGPTIAGQADRRVLPDADRSSVEIEEPHAVSDLMDRLRRVEADEAEHELLLHMGGRQPVVAGRQPTLPPPVPPLRSSARGLPTALPDRQRLTPGTSIPGSSDVDPGPTAADLMDELADRLTEAAEELGIDIHD